MQCVQIWNRHPPSKERSEYFRTSIRLGRLYSGAYSLLLVFRALRDEIVQWKHDLGGGGMTKQWLACFEQLRSKVDYRTWGREKHFGAHFGLCLLQTCPFLVDPGTGIPIKNDLPTLGKRSANCVAHAKQDKTVICKIMFYGFFAFNKGSSFSYYENKDPV